MKKKKLLRSTFTYDKKIAKRMCNIEYYHAQSENMSMYDFIQKEKSRLSTPKWDKITEILDDYKTKGLSHWESPMGKTLLGIYKKNRFAALNRTIVLNSNILKVVSHPETLLLAYKAIKGNKGALTPAADKSKEDLERMDDEQKALYFKSKIFPDKFSLRDVYLTGSLLKRGLYPWGSSSRVSVPKPGVKFKKRPITIPPFLDRVVQKAITMALEAIYEPEFELLNRSFGFRPNKSTHDAIIALTSLYSSGKTTAIEGDIQAAYDTIKKDKLLDILGKKITDRKFLNLIKERLNYDYVEIIDGKKVRSRPALGIPQGGIDSPYLFNIYMNEFDKYVHNSIQSYLDSLNKTRSILDPNKKVMRFKRCYNKNYNINMALLQKNIRRQKKLKTQLKGSTELGEVKDLRIKLFDTIKKKRYLIHLKNKIRSKHPHRAYLSLFYVRYADDWIFLLNGNTELGNKIKAMLSCFLATELGLKLSEEKTSVTKINKVPAHFLGFELKHPYSGPLIRKAVDSSKWLVTKKKANLQRRAGTIVWAAPDKQRLVNRLHMKGFCDKKGFPRELPWLSCFEPHIIVERFNAVIRGFSEFYVGFIRNQADLQRWIYIIRMSCIKTLAQKYKTSIKGIYKKFGSLHNNPSLKTIVVKAQLKTGDDIMEKTWTLWSYKSVIKQIKANKRLRLKNLKEKFWRIEKERELGDYPSRAGRIPSVTNENYLDKISWTSLRTQASFDMPCAACGSFKNVHQHHITHVRKTSYALLAEEMPWRKVMALRNRKQVSLCADCHINKVHRGKYNGERLINLSRTLVDNRIVHVESFVKPGIEYNTRTLEERGWKNISLHPIKTLSSENAFDLYSRDSNDLYSEEYIEPYTGEYSDPDSGKKKKQNYEKKQII